MTEQEIYQVLRDTLIELFEIEPERITPIPIFTKI